LSRKDNTITANSLRGPRVLPAGSKRYAVGQIAAGQGADHIVMGKAMRNSVWHVPTVSIIIPVYNDEAHVADAIDSALNQTLKEVEVIVVDDGSTDGTPDVLKRYEGRAKIIRQENAGVSAARNAGFKDSCGKYVCFLDSDDMVVPKMAETMSDLLEEDQEAGLCFGAWQVTDVKDGTSSRHTAPPLEDFTEYLTLGCPSPPNSTVIRRNWFEKIGGFDETLRSCDDWDLWRRLWLAGCKVVRTEEAVGIFRRREDSKSRNPGSIDYYVGSLDKYVSGLGARATAALQSKAYSTLWLKDGTKWTRAGEPSRAIDSWAEALNHDPQIFERGATWGLVLRYADPSFPHSTKHTRLWFAQMDHSIRSVLKESIAQCSRTRKEVPSYRRAVAALRFALSIAFFRDGFGWQARRWLLAAIMLSPLRLLGRPNWRFIFKIILGPMICMFFRRLESKEAGSE